MKKILLFICSFAALAATAKTQIVVGPEAGINISNYYGRTAGFKQKFTTSITGARLGAVADISLTKKIYLLPGLCFARNGYNLVATDLYGNIFTFSFRASTIELPVNLLYKVNFHNGNKLFFGLGPYAAANVGGRIRSDFVPADKGGLAIGSANSDDIKRFDFGAGISAGYQLPRNLLIHLHYQHSLVNQQPGGNTDNSVQNVNYGVALGYLFGVTKPKPEYKRKPTIVKPR